MVKQYSSEVVSLRDRIVKGNDKLFKAWLQIKELANDRDEWDRQMDLWNEAQRKLSLLCSELKLRGYEDCLYIDNNGNKTKSCLNEPGGWWCQVCPSTRCYWEEELMSLPSPKVAQKKGGTEQGKFIEKLGGKQ